MDGQTSSTAPLHKSPFQRSVESVANLLGAAITWMAERGVLFGVFGLLWLGVLAGLLLNPSAVDDLWSYIGGMHVVAQLLLWLLFLPVMAGLWVWQTDWPVVLRAAIVLGLAAWTLLVMKPRWLRLPGRSAGSSG